MSNEVTTGRRARFWTALALEYRFMALLCGLAGLWASLYGTHLRLRPEAAGPRDTTYLRPELPVTVLILLVMAFLLWRATPALVTGRPRWARPTAALALLLAVIGSAGGALIGLGLAYLLAGREQRRIGAPSRTSR